MIRKTAIINDDIYFLKLIRNISNFKQNLYISTTLSNIIKKYKDMFPIDMFIELSSKR